MESDVVQKTVVASARKLAEKKFGPLAAKWDKEETFPAVNVPDLAQAGLLGILIPEKYGGLESSPLTAGLVVEEIAKVCRNTSPIVQLNNGIGAFITEHGTGAAKEKYLRKLATGEMTSAFAITEPDSGSSLRHMKTIARQTDGGYEINGVKHMVTMAGVADLFIVFAYVQKKDGDPRISAMIVESKSPGVSTGKFEGTMGLRGGDHREIIFENCFVPEENLIDKGFREIMGSFNIDRCLNAAVCIGIGRAAVEESTRYMQTRRLGENVLTDFQGLNWILADMVIELEAAKSLLHNVLANAQGLHIPAFESSVAKVKANEMAFDVANKAMQIFGGFGYAEELPIERMLRDARAYQVGAGSIQILRNVIARELRKQFPAG